MRDWRRTFVRVFARAGVVAWESAYLASTKSLSSIAGSVKTTTKMPSQYSEGNDSWH